MRKQWIAVFLTFGLIALLLFACTQETPTVSITPTETLAGTLNLYPSDTPTATPWPTGYNSPTPSPTITPTATQVYYEVQSGDDMYSIGYAFDVSPQAIMTANPTVDPRAMSIGLSLLIPVTPQPELTSTTTEKTQVAEATATPDPSDLGEPDCYLDSLGGLWCFVLVESSKTGVLENVSAIITLSGEDETRQESAALPLNLLPEEESLPLIAYFQPPVLENYTASAEIEFSLPVMADDQRYLDTEITEQNVALSDDGLVADVSGVVHLPEDGADASYVWISATAFDEDDHILAVRRWDSMESLSAGGDQTFELTIYSMGGTIDRVDLVVEARAVDVESEEE